MVIKSLTFFPPELLRSSSLVLCPYCHYFRFKKSIRQSALYTLQQIPLITGDPISLLNGGLSLVRILMLLSAQPYRSVLPLSGNHQP